LKGGKKKKKKEEKKRVFISSIGIFDLVGE